jgi:hypothetical protein
MLQSKMAAAREAAREATGSSGPAADLRIPIDALPPVEFRDVALKFAPKDEPDLGVERGMAIKGRMLLGAGADSSLSEIGAVDVNVGEDGFWVRGRLSGYQLGPLSWDDALLDLTATREEQRLRLSGDVQLLGNRQKVDLDFSRTQMRFNTVTQLFGVFRAQVDAVAAIDLKQPKFKVHAVAESDLDGALQPILRGGATAFANVSGTLINQADAAIGGIRTTLDRADATVAQLVAALEQQRAAARANIDAAQARANEIYPQVTSARAARDAAYNLWNGTPLRQPALKASRRAAWIAAAARYNTAAARYAALAAVANSARRVLDALPPPDRNLAVMAATAASQAIRTQLETAERNLQALRDQHEAFVAALAEGGTLLAISLAEVNADLESMRAGQALQWHLVGTFVNRPFDITAAVDFSDIAAAGGTLISSLVHR